MNWELIVSRGKQQGKHILLSRSVVHVGREDGCRIRASSDVVSRRHCTLKRFGEHLFVIDCHSTNGTFVNGRRLLPELPVELFSGDHLSVGPLHLVIDTVQEPPDPSEDIAAEMLLALDREEDGPEPQGHSPDETSPVQTPIGQPESSATPSSSSDVAGQLLNQAMRRSRRVSPIN